MKSEGSITSKDCGRKKVGSAGCWNGGIEEVLFFCWTSMRWGIYLVCIAHVSGRSCLSKGGAIDIGSILICMGVQEMEVDLEHCLMRVDKM